MSASEKANLARIRDNQRRSRARRKEYLHELEARLRQCDLQGIEASAEIQLAARRVVDENRKLRTLLVQRGVGEEEVDGWLKSNPYIPQGGGHDVASSRGGVGSDGQNAIQILERLLVRRKNIENTSSMWLPGLSMAGPGGDGTGGRGGSATSSSTAQSGWNPSSSYMAHGEHQSSDNLVPLRESIQQGYGHTLMTPESSIGPASSIGIAHAPVPIPLSQQSSQQYHPDKATMSSLNHNRSNPTSTTSLYGQGQRHNRIPSNQASGVNIFNFDDDQQLFQNAEHSQTDCPRSTVQNRNLDHNRSASGVPHPIIHGQAQLRSSRCTPTVPATNSVTENQNTGSCVYAADMITTMAGGDPEDVKVELGCDLETDCQVDNQLIFDLMDRYSGRRAP